MSATQLMTAPPQQRTLGGIGASEAAAAIGASDYATPLDAWLVLTGRVAGFDGNEATEWGHVLEPIIRARYVERHQVSVHVPPESLWHRDLPWLKATPDGIVLDERGAWLFVGPQVKNVGLRMAPAWEDGLPADYLIQGVVEMAVTDLPRIDFAVLVGGQSYREVTLERDVELEATVIEGLAAFWRLVETDTQPAIDESKRMRALLLGKLKKSARRAVVSATEEDLAVIARWRDLVIEQTKLKREEREIKNRVLAALAAGDAGRMTSPLGAISLGAARKKTAWKDVAHAAPGAKHISERIAAELAAELAAAEGEDDLRARMQTLVASIECAAAVAPSLGELIAANTTIGDPVLNRPRGWTKDLDDSDGDDE